MAMPKSHIAMRGKDGTVKGYRVIPYVRMVQSGEAIGVYNGSFVNDQGGLIEDHMAPAWARDRVTRMPESRRERLGMQRFDKVPPMELKPADDPEGEDEVETEDSEDDETEE